MTSQDRKMVTTCIREAAKFAATGRRDDAAYALRVARQYGWKTIKGLKTVRTMWAGR